MNLSRPVIVIVGDAHQYADGLDNHYRGVVVLSAAAARQTYSMNATGPVEHEDDLSLCAAIPGPRRH